MMFCAFDGDPLILRLYGTAETLHPRDPAWPTASADFPTLAGSRQIFDVTIEAVQTSCGTGVPIMAYEAERAETDLVPYYDEMGPDGVTAYWRKKNTKTIDGYPTGLFEEDE